MKRTITAFHPSRGPIGSIYATADGKHYVHTPFGVRTLDPSVGPSLARRQRFYGNVMRAYVRTFLWCAALSFAVGVAAGALGHARLGSH